MVTYTASKQGYINLWKQAVIRPQFVSQSAAWARRIAAGRSRYLAIEQRTGVPWYLVGLLHMRESSLDFSTYLGNGQPLNRVTTLVPAGRGPFATFEDGAVDALDLQLFNRFTDWPISRILWAAETFNGQGYYNVRPPINSPYLWSWTNQYTAGKFTGDGVYNPAAVDSQPGVASVLGSLIANYPEIADRLAAYEEEPVAGTTPTPVPTPVPVPTPTPVPAPADPYDAMINFLKAQGKWPKPGTISIATAGNVTIIVNGKVVVQGEE